jgi:hypothetical protein
MNGVRRGKIKLLSQEFVEDRNGGYWSGRPLDEEHYGATVMPPSLQGGLTTGNILRVHGEIKMPSPESITCIYCGHLTPKGRDCEYCGGNPQAED